MLAKKYRLTKRGSFTYVYNKGERKSDKLLGVVFVRARALRIGFSVPNKVGKAVVRNRLKRRLRALSRTLVTALAPAQIVVTARPGAEGLSFEALKSLLNGLFVRTGLLSAAKDGGGRTGGKA
jgi:ribonuclease P protein component